MARVVVTAKDNGRSIRLRSDEQLLIELAGNASTGYSWKVLKGTPGILNWGRTTYKENAHPVGMVGVGGVYTTPFLPFGPGTVTIVLGYIGPGRNAPVAKRFTLRVTVFR